MTQVTDEPRHTRGLARLAELDGKNGENTVASMRELGRYLVEFGFGDIYSRSGLSLRDREFAAVAMLIAMGRDQQVRFHLRAALNVGLTAEELEELIIHTVPFAGFPTAINALQALKQVLAEAPSS